MEFVKKIKWGFVFETVAEFCFQWVYAASTMLAGVLFFVVTFQGRPDPLVIAYAFIFLSLIITLFGRAFTNESGEDDEHKESPVAEYD